MRHPTYAAAVAAVLATTLAAWSADPARAAEAREKRPVRRRATGEQFAGALVACGSGHQWDFGLEYPGPALGAVSGFGSAAATASAPLSSAPPCFADE